MRDWKKFENDEIMTVWKGYIAQDFGGHDPLRQRLHYPRGIRLSPMEIHALVEELMDRLEMKFKEPE